MSNRVISWVEEHAGLWILWTLTVGLLTLIGTSSWWGITTQDQRIDNRITSEVNRLEAAIAGVKTDVNRIERKIDTLGETLGTRIETPGTRLGTRLDARKPGRSNL